MKIAVLGTRGFPGIQGGVEKHCEELYPRLAKFGHEITVFNRSPYFKKENRVFLSQGVRFVYLWCPKSKNFETVFHTFFASLYCIFKKPDIAHFHNIGPALFIPFLKAFGIKTVITYHSSNYRHQKWNVFAKAVLKFGEVIGLRFADKVIVVCETSKKILEKKRKREDLVLIPNGVNIAKQKPEGSFLEKHGLFPKRYILAVSRFSPEKGLTDLIFAFKKSLLQGFKLVIAGSADYETGYSMKIRDSSIESKDIVLTGVVSGLDLQELYTNAGLFVLPSHEEGFSIALLEALSYGLPVLVSDLPQNKEIVSSESRFFKTGCIESLAGRISELAGKDLSDQEKLNQISLMEKKYNWDAISTHTDNVYNMIG